MKQQSGFSLIELMISLVLGLIILSGVIQVFVSTRATNSLNQAIAEIQEYGRYITLRIQDELREVGRYDMNTTNIENSTDLVLESSFVLRQPVAIANDYRRTMGETGLGKISPSVLGTMMDGTGQSSVIRSSELTGISFSPRLPAIDRLGLS
ncbi:MAG: hypothetical protein CL586_07830, partial [Alteromonadaceae bacterium]|nr:hypothetical protein [Alteromonadaceae bacterium]